MADRPRWWKSGSVYSEVRNCIDNMFLLKPSPEIRNIIGACLGRAQAQFPVKIYWVDPNVTHEHRGREPFEGMEQNMSDFERQFVRRVSKRGIQTTVKDAPPDQAAARHIDKNSQNWNPAVSVTKFWARGPDRLGSEGTAGAR